MITDASSPTFSVVDDVLVNGNEPDAPIPDHTKPHVCVALIVYWPGSSYTYPHVGDGVPGGCAPFTHGVDTAHRTTCPSPMSYEVDS